MKIKIYYGPRKAFDEILPDGIRPKTLTELVEISDQEKRNVHVERPDGAKEKKTETKF